MILRHISKELRAERIVTRRWAIDACKTFFHLTDTDEQTIAGVEGTQRLQLLWKSHPDTFYEHPLQILRQEWFHAIKTWYRHDGFWLPLPPHARVLDYGCGTGEVARLPWIFRGGHLDAVEHSTACRAYLQQKYCKWSVTVLKTMPTLEGDSLYDAIICTDVLEHLPDPLAIQQHLWEYLKPKGYALLKFATEWPHPGHLREAIAQREKWKDWLRNHADIIENDTYCWCQKR